MKEDDAIFNVLRGIHQNILKKILLKVTVIVKLGIEAAKRELGNLKQPAS
jgi:hypothetical protein